MSHNDILSVCVGKGYICIVAKTSKMINLQIVLKQLPFQVNFLVGA